MAAAHSTHTLPATVVIKAEKDVKVTVNGQSTNRNSEEETFSTPALAVGQTYSYDVVATVVRNGKTLTANKRVQVRAGEQSAVEFGDLKDLKELPREESARVTVLLPEGGTLYVEGQPYGNKEKQTFDTPKLARGKSYYYTLEMRMKANNSSQTKRVSVEPGQEVTVDFRTQNVSAR